MSDSQKPFACTIFGCNMSFVNEDHLTVHKKKHDMMLNLGINSKNNVFIADQTPTPTRFIRNCDEVGLFQDLHNDNPFEETFRRAVESNKRSDVSVTEQNDDTLHTPNILIHVTEKSLDNVTLKKSTTTALETVANEKEDIIEENIIESNNNQILPNNSSVEVESIDKLKTHVPINATEMQLLLKTEDGKVLRFVAAPVANDIDYVAIQPESKTKPTSSNGNDKKPNIKIVSNQKLSMAKMKLKQTLIKNGTIIENQSSTRNVTMDSSRGKSKIKIDTVKKQAIKERNRASSMRARAKRKAWIEQLQNSLKVANETNTSLHAQLNNLHGQIAKLKALLLAHKDCPVTKAMEKENEIVVSSKVIAIKPNLVRSIPIIPGEPIKRASSEKSILPNKKSIILPKLISPIIIPASSASSNTITLHAGDTIKSVPTVNIVTPLVTNSENGEAIISFVSTDNVNCKKKIIQKNNFIINQKLTLNRELIESKDNT